MTAPAAELAGAIEQAKALVAFSVRTDAPCAFEVVRNARGSLNVQPFGMHALFKSHRLLHVEPLPHGPRAAVEGAAA